MKFAIAALIATAAADCFQDCGCVNFGDEPKMIKQSACIFNNATGGHKEMNVAQGTAELEKYCLYETDNYTAAGKAECK